ncbi:MAG: hypothetical protein ACE5HP_10615 [Gemmatimonadota bacterium]
MKANGEARRRIAWLLAAAILGLHAALAWAARQPDVTTGGDAAQYLLLARALRGLGYGDPYIVGTPFHSHYLPGFPLLIAAWTAIVGESFRALIALNVALSVGALFLVYATLARLWSPWIGLLVLLPVAVNPGLVTRAGSGMSEPAYMLFSLAALVALSGQGAGRRRSLVAGGCAIFAALIRPIGISLLAALGLYWLARRRWRALVAFGLASLATVGAWLILILLAPRQFAGDSYVADFVAYSEIGGAVGFLRVLFSKAAEALGSQLLDALALPLLSGALWDNVAWAAVVWVGGLLGLRLYCRRWSTAALYLLGYAVFLAAYPWITKRYLDPILPLVIPAVVLGTGAALARWRPGVSRAAMIGLAVLLAAAGVVQSAEVIRERRGCGGSVFQGARDCLSAGQAGYFDALGYLRGHTDGTAVVLAARGAPLYYHTGRLTSPYGEVFVYGPDRFREYAERYAVDYVLLGRLSNSEADLARILSRRCGMLRLVERFSGEVYLFAISDASAPASESEACRVLSGYLEGSPRPEQDRVIGASDSPR